MEQGGTAPSNNIATACCAVTAFGSTQYNPWHNIQYIRDGVYGNANSWVCDPGDTNPFVGLNLGQMALISGFAFGRDNTAAYADRTMGLYVLQYTRVATPT